MTTLLTSFAQGTHSAKPAAAAGNAGRYYWETDTTTLWQSTGSAWTQLATLAAFVASGSSHAAGLVPDPGSSAGSTHFLREDATWAVPAGGGGSLTTQTSYLGSDATWSNDSAWHDGPTITLAAGTWLLTGFITGRTAGGSNGMSVKLWDGTTAFSSGLMAVIESDEGSITLAAVVTPSTSTTYRMAANTNGNGNGTICAAIAVYAAAGNTASGLVALQVA